MNADRAGLANEIMHDGAMQYLEPARATGFSDHDLGNVVGLGVSDDLVSDLPARNGDRRPAEPGGEPQVIGDTVPLAIAQPGGFRRLDMDRGPRRVQPVGRATGVADQSRRIRRFADADQDALARRPRSGYRMGTRVRLELLVEVLRGLPQRQFAQRGEIARLEIVPHGALGL